MLLVSNHEDSGALLGGVGEDNRAGKALVAGGIVVLEADLELDGLSELALLGDLGVLKDSVDGLLQTLLVKLAHSDDKSGKGVNEQDYEQRKALGRAKGGAWEQSQKGADEFAAER